MTTKNETSENQAQCSIQNVRQRFYNWLAKINKRHSIVMIWWRYDNKGTPHKIGWRLFNGKIYIRYRNVA